jgi:hypothetical protein
LIIIPESKFPNLFDVPHIRTACVIAETLLDVYIHDVLSLIDKAIREPCVPNSEAGNLQTRTWADKRLAALTNLKKHAKPLSYDAYDLLVECISDSPDQVALGVPMFNNEALTHYDFAVLLTQFRSSVESHDILPPLFTTGSLRTVLPVALQFMDQQCDDSGLEQRNEFCARIIAFVARFKRIQNVPWTLKSSTRRALRKVVYNSWRNVSSTERSVLQPLAMTDVSLSPGKRSAKRALLQDPHSEWTAADLTISTIHTILHKSSLPSEWDDLSMIVTEDNYVQDTYEWVKANADLNKPTHQLAIILAILFSKVVPAIGYDDDIMKLGLG